MAVSRTDEITDISKSLEGVGIDFGDPFKDSSIESSNAVLLGATLRTSTSFGKAATVAPGEDIRVAINALKSAGGGTLILLAGTHRPTYDIEGFSGLNIVGEGSGNTIIDFEGGAYGVKFIGTATDIIANFKLKDFSVKNSNATAGINIDYAEYFRGEGVRVTSCDQIGILIDRAQYYSFLDISSDNNTGVGTHLKESSGRAHSSGAFTQCFWDSNSSDNVLVDSGVSYVNFVACTNINADGDGYEISGSSIVIVGGNAGGNGAVSGINVYITTSSSGCIAVGLNTSVSSIDTNAVTLSNFSTFGGRQNIATMRNYSGSTINQGDVVIREVVDFAKEDSASHTTSAGDYKVVGMAIESAENTSSFRVLIEGETALLKVDGTTDIAVGDYLSTFTTAGIAKKASAGETVFAIALEAYTTDDSNGVIDAYILPWRMKI